MDDKELKSLLQFSTVFDSRKTIKLYFDELYPQGDDVVEHRLDTVVDLTEQFIKTIRDVQHEIVNALDIHYDTDAALERLKELEQRRKYLVGMIESRAVYLLHAHLYDVAHSRHIEEQDIDSCKPLNLFEDSVVEEALLAYPVFASDIEKIRAGELNHRRSDKASFITAYNQYWSTRLSTQELDRAWQESRERNETPIQAARSIEQRCWKYQATIMAPVGALIRQAFEEGISEREIIFATAWIAPQAASFMRTQKRGQSGKWYSPGLRLKNSLEFERGGADIGDIVAEFLTPVTEVLGASTFEQLVSLAGLVSNRVCKELHRTTEIKKKIQGEVVRTRIYSECDLPDKDAFSDDNMDSLDTFVNMETELSELIDKAQLAKNELEIVMLLQQEDYTNVELASLLNRSASQIGVEKKRAFDKIRAAKTG